MDFAADADTGLDADVDADFDCCASGGKSQGVGCRPIHFLCLPALSRLSLDNCWYCAKRWRSQHRRRHFNGRKMTAWPRLEYLQRARIKCCLKERSLLRSCSLI